MRQMKTAEAMIDAVRGADPRHRPASALRRPAGRGSESTGRKIFGDASPGSFCAAALCLHTSDERAAPAAGSGGRRGVERSVAVDLVRPRSVQVSPGADVGRA